VKFSSSERLVFSESLSDIKKIQQQLDPHPHHHHHPYDKREKF